MAQLAPVASVAPVSATEHAILLSLEQVPFFRTSPYMNELRHRKREEDARDLLKKLAWRKSSAYDCCGLLDISGWPYWKRYISCNPHATDIVGPGVVAVSAVRMPDKSFEILIARADGTACRLHPGSSPFAKLVYVPAQGAQSISSTEQVTTTSRAATETGGSPSSGGATEHAREEARLANDKVG